MDWAMSRKFTSKGEEDAYEQSDRKSPVRPATGDGGPPKVGGFPYLAENSRRAGVTRNSWCSRSQQGRKSRLVRVGEISLGLEKAQNQYALPSNGKSKAEQFARAGLSTSTAHRYEPLVGESMEIASQASSKADSSATTSHPFC